MSDSHFLFFSLRQVQLVFKRDSCDDNLPIGRPGDLFLQNLTTFSQNGEVDLSALPPTWCCACAVCCRARFGLPWRKEPISQVCSDFVIPMSNDKASFISSNWCARRKMLQRLNKGKPRCCFLLISRKMSHKKKERFFV